jgi:hypothetical protein
MLFAICAKSGKRRLAALSAAAELLKNSRRLKENTIPLFE